VKREPDGAQEAAEIVALATFLLGLTESEDRGETK
jgi:hypothetical protein